MITLITNDAESDGFGCPYCDKAKDALERAGVEFSVQRVAAEHRPAMYDAWGADWQRAHDPAANR